MPTIPYNLGDNYERARITPDIFNKIVDDIYSRIQRNTSLQLHMKDVQDAVAVEISTHTFNPRRIFNYYENKWSYFYDKDIQFIKNAVYETLTHEYNFKRMQRANKLASNPWNNEYAKNKHQKIKTNSIKMTNKLTASRTYNPIEPCFL